MTLIILKHRPIKRFFFICKFNPFWIDSSSGDSYLCEVDKYLNVKVFCEDSLVLYSNLVERKNRMFLLISGAVKDELLFDINPSFIDSGRIIYHKNIYRIPDGLFSTKIQDLGIEFPRIPCFFGGGGWSVCYLYNQENLFCAISIMVVGYGCSLYYNSG